MPRARKAVAAPPSPYRVTVSVERGGASLTVPDVPMDDAGKMLAALLEAMALAQRQCAALRSVVECVPGGAPTEVVDDYYTGEDRARRVGF